MSPDCGGRPVLPTGGGQGAVLFTSDPADGAVSLNRCPCWDLERCVAFLLNEKAAPCRLGLRSGHQVRRFMGRWVNQVISGVDQRAIPVLAVLSQDLLMAPERALHRLVACLKLPADSDLIAAAAAAVNTRFAKLRAKENQEHQEGGFHRPIPLHPPRQLMPALQSHHREFCASEPDGEVCLVHPDPDQDLNLNRTATAIGRQLEQPLSRDALVTALVAGHDVEEAHGRQDTESFLAEALVTSRLVETPAP